MCSAAKGVVARARGLTVREKASGRQRGHRRSPSLLPEAYFLINFLSRRAQTTSEERALKRRRAQTSENSVYANFAECPKGEVRIAPSARSGGPTTGGASYALLMFSVSYVRQLPVHLYLEH